MTYLVINGERGSMHAPDFKGKMMRTRKELLNEITKNFASKGKSKRKADSSPVLLRSGAQTPRKATDADPQPTRMADVPGCST